MATAQKNNSALQTFTFTVPTKGLRFDQFLALQFPAISLTKLRNAIKTGEARLNNRTSYAGWILRAGDQLTIKIDTDEPSASLPENIPLEILFEDDDLIVINKPSNLLSHPSHVEKSGTVMNALAFYFLQQQQKTGKAAVRPTLLHRLDRDTSGVLVIAKNDRANRVVSKAFRDRKIQKKYLALVYGVVAEPSGEINAPIGRTSHTWPRWSVKDDGEPSQTNFFVREHFAAHTLLELAPLTGRTHQLRIHCAHLGHTIVGEQIYKGNFTGQAIAGFKISHQLLHAHSLTLRLPSTNEDKEFIAPLPTMFAAVLQHLQTQ